MQEKIKLFLQKKPPDDSLQTEIDSILSDHQFDLSKIDNLIFKVLDTLDPIFISNGNNLKPFWNHHSKVQSNHLWCPSKTDLKDTSSDSNAWYQNKKMITESMDYSKTNLASSINTNHQQRNLLNSQIDSDASIFRTRKLRMKPNLQQRIILNEYMGVYRWFYNRTIELAEKTHVYNDIKLKKEMRNKERHFDKPSWLTLNKIPSRLVTGAIQDCCDAYKSAFSNLQNKNISKFKMQSKTKKNPNQTLVVEKDTIGKNNQIFITFFKNTGPIKMENLKERRNKKTKTILYKDIKIESDCRIKYNRDLRTFDLIIPIKKKISNYKPVEDPVIALDPGVRTFQTGYLCRSELLVISWNMVDLKNIQDVFKDSYYSKIKYEAL